MRKELFTKYLEQLSDESADIQMSAALRLGHYGVIEAIPAIIKCLENEPSYTNHKHVYVLALGLLGHTDALEYLRTMSTALAIEYATKQYSFEDTSDLRRELHNAIIRIEKREAGKENQVRMAVKARAKKNGLPFLDLIVEIKNRGLGAVTRITTEDGRQYDFCQTGYGDSQRSVSPLFSYLSEIESYHSILTTARNRILKDEAIESDGSSFSSWLNSI